MQGTIPELFERAVADFAGRRAIVGAGEAWTYAEFGARVHGLAERLVRAGVEPGDRVAVLDWNTRFLLAAYFAAPLVGAVLVPLNHRLAPAEIGEILEDAGASVVFAADDLRARLAGGDAVRVEPAVLDAAADALESPSGPGPDELAQLYYTSGTTGRAKGVMLTHRNVCTHAAWAVRELELTAGDHWGHFAPLFHLADAWATFALTAVGGVHVVEPRFSAARALAAIERERVTITNLVPTMLTAMVNAPEARRFDPSSLRAILSGGAPITPALVRRIVDVFRCEYVQTYGMTETSPYLTLSLLSEAMRDLPRDEQLRYAARTGRPFGDVELEVVDESGARVPADDRTVGEIRVRAVTVSPGYWKRPRETAAAHRDGWLYTGDLAVVDAEGFVDIVDRKKDMILTGGENVYSIEVEAALAEHPAIASCAVFGQPDEEWGEVVCAAVVARNDVGEDELRSWCRERIADFKIPRRIMFVSDLPKTGSGKVSKRELRRRFA
jgi:acyl-CoA synthetase (AMP-forming)/AMP-acid ligase II